jgi:hypothetical protein
MENSMITNMQSSIDYAKTWNVKEPWMEGALKEDIEAMEETMNLYACNPNTFWQGKFIKIYKRAKNLQKVAI